MDRQLLKVLEHDTLLATRVERLMTIPGVGTVLAVTWALEGHQDARSQIDDCLVRLKFKTQRTYEHDALDSRLEQTQ